jgi:hypothetical protein
VINYNIKSKNNFITSIQNVLAKYSDEKLGACDVVLFGCCMAAGFSPEIDKKKQLGNKFLD